MDTASDFRGKVLQSQVLMWFDYRDGQIFLGKILEGVDCTITGIENTTAYSFLESPQAIMVKNLVMMDSIHSPVIRARVDMDRLVRQVRQG